MKNAFANQKPESGLHATVLTRGEHNISRNDISENALKVLYRLHNNGYQAYLVGGCVRDLMLGHKPKDFDVTTNATPEQVKDLFKNCRLIGRRFRLAHIVFGRDIIEVATFRGHHESDEGKEKLGKQDAQGQIVRDNVFGTIEEDAERRDFTINAMYYNIADFSVHDFADGKAAINNKEISMIGDPEVRYREDPVRMLRAVRFAAKLDMHIAPDTAQPINDLAPMLANIPPARLFDEVIKLFLSGNGFDTFVLMQKFGLLSQLFPQMEPLLKDTSSREYRFIEKVLKNTDARINSGKRVTPAFMYAAFLWYPIEDRCQHLIFEAGMSQHDAFNIAMSDVLHRQLQRIMIPKRFSAVMRDIWQAQHRLAKRFGKRAYQQLEHPKFRAGYDFLLIRGEVEGGELLELADWWTTFQDTSPKTRQKMLNDLRNNSGRTPRKRSKKPKAD